jgi:hypothetical protein
MNKIFNKFFIGLSFVFITIIILSNRVYAAALPVTVTASPPTVVYGGTSTISWNSPTATSCGVTSKTVPARPPTDPDPYINAGGNGNTGSFTTSSFYTTTIFTVSCANNPTPPVAPPTCTTGDSFNVPLSACFIADTVVTMADGSTKKIQDVKIDDVLKGEKTNNKVLGFHRPALNGKLYSLNGGRYFVTEEHPFKTTDGWKSINPEKTKNENIGIIVTKLKVGDTLITDKGKVLLKTVNSKIGKADTELFNFLLDGDHSYYADGYLVHNKQACDLTHLCTGTDRCIDGTGLLVGVNSPYDYGMCAPCPGACPANYTASCGGQVTVCTATAAACSGGSGSGVCTGSGSCSTYTTQSTCQTHGCTWLAS